MIRTTGLQFAHSVLRQLTERRTGIAAALLLAPLSMAVPAAYADDVPALAAPGAAAPEEPGKAPAPAAAPEEAGPGLTGLFPEESPRSLDFDAFGNLGENWADWGEKAALEVSELYGGEAATVAEQRKLIDSLRSRLRVMQAALNDPAYEVIHTSLTGLYGRLTRRVDLAEAILDTLALDPSEIGQPGLQAAGAEVLAALGQVEQHLSQYEKGEAWFPWLGGDKVPAAAKAGWSADVAVPILSAVREKLNFKAEGDAQAQFLAAQPFRQLDQAIGNYLNAAGSIPQGDSWVEPLRADLSRLVAAAEAYEQDATAGAAADLRAAYGSLSRTAPDGGAAVTAVLRRYYFNDNFEMILSENLLDRLVYDHDQRAGCIYDFVLGAQVTGHQITNSRAGIDVLPSSNGARMQITLNGTVHSNSRGDTSQATVFTTGNHSFYGSRPIYFDGHRFAAGQSLINVNARNITRGVETKYDWIPIIGSIANKKARQEVARRQPEAEAITANKIASQVYPEFTSKIDGSLADANRDLETDLNKRLRATGLYPETRYASSSDQFVRVSGRVWKDGELAGSYEPPPFVPARSLTLQIHESLLNNMADRWGFAGRTMTEDEVNQELEAYFSTLLGRKVSFSDREPGEGPNIYVFDKSDPVRFKVEDGVVNLIIRAAFRQEGKEDIPTQIVTIPLTYGVDGSKIVTERGIVRIEPAETPESTARQIARAGVIRKKIESSMGTETRENTIELDAANNRKVTLFINKITTLNGWVTVFAD